MRTRAGRKYSIAHSIMRLSLTDKKLEVDNKVSKPLLICDCDKAILISVLNKTVVVGMVVQISNERKAPA